jgi:hypothetical protein
MTSSRLRWSGLLATAVFLVMVVSDLLMLTSLDFSRPYRGFWAEAGGLPQSQVTWGYYLGELTIPFYSIGGWHLSLAVRPAGTWASRLVFWATAYGASILTVWHASFMFIRSILRAEVAGGAASDGPSPEALLAYSTFALPLFRVGLVLSGITFLFVLGLILSGRTLYPRWAAVALPGAFTGVGFLLEPYVPVGAAVVLRAAAWNAGGAALFALSTALLWNRDASL